MHIRSDIGNMHMKEKSHRGDTLTKRRTHGRHAHKGTWI